MRLLILLLVTTASAIKFESEVRNKQECHEDYKAKKGDILTVQYDAFQQDGTRFNTTQGYEPLNIVLGDGAVLPHWEEALLGMCAGEQLVMVVMNNTEKLFYIMAVDVITRKVEEAPSSSHHYGILLHSKGKCPEANKVKIGSLVMMNTTARIPNLLYLKYPDKFPKSNVPTKIAEKGAIGVKVDESIDSVRAGVGDIIQGWDLGISQACQGETRMIMMSSEMAYGQVGAFRVIPPQAPLVLDVEIMQVENYAGVDHSLEGRDPRNS